MDQQILNAVQIVESQVSSIFRFKINFSLLKMWLINHLFVKIVRFGNRKVRQLGLDRFGANKKETYRSNEKSPASKDWVGEKW